MMISQRGVAMGRKSITGGVTPAGLSRVQFDFVIDPGTLPSYPPLAARCSITSGGQSWGVFHSWVPCFAPRLGRGSG